MKDQETSRQYNLKDENGESGEEYSVHPLMLKIISIRSQIDGLVDEITKDIECPDVHYIMENVAFNIWLYHLKAIRGISKSWARKTVEFGMEILENDFLKDSEDK